MRDPKGRDPLGHGRNDVAAVAAGEPAAIWGSVPLEELDFAFVFFGGGSGCECAEVAALAGGGVFLAGIESVFA